MRKLLWAAILAGSAALAACGGGEDDGGGGGKNNPGGSGGTGGVGGTDNTGGTGGDGGTTADPGCGDDVRDAGEECDDGNIFDGDGCSSTCTIEDGSCAEPRHYNFVATLGANRIYSHGGLLEGASALDTCGEGGGSEIAYKFDVSRDGLLQVVVVPEGQTLVSIAGTCGDASTELSCRPGGQQANVEVTKNQVVYLVVDSPATAQNVEYNLAVRLVPILEEGETCTTGEQAAVHGSCAEGLVCTTVIGSGQICQQPSAPDLASAHASRTGDDFTVMVSGEDADKDAQGMFVSFLDASGNVIQVTEPGAGSVDELKLPFDPPVAGTSFFLNAARILSGFFVSNPEAAAATHVDVTVYDAFDLRSETERVAIAD